MLEIGKNYQINRARYNYYINKYNWCSEIYKGNVKFTKVTGEIIGSSQDINSCGDTKFYTVEYNMICYYLPEDCFISRRSKLERILNVR